MKKSLFLLFFILLASFLVSKVYAATITGSMLPGYVVVSNTLPGNGYGQGVAESSNGQYIWVAGNNTWGSTGSLFYSTDGGITFSTSSTAGSHRWGPVAVSSNGQIIAAGSGNCCGSGDDDLYISTNGGTNWNPQVLGGLINGQPNYDAGAMVELAMSGNGQEILVQDDSGVTYSNKLYFTSNGGASWSQLTNLGSWNWNFSISSDGGTIAVANANTVYISVNNGSTWESQSLSTDSSDTINVAAANNGIVYATVASTGLLEKYTNGTWASLPVFSTIGPLIWNAGKDPAFPIIAVSADGSHIIIQTGSIIVSTDSGNTWHTDEQDIGKSTYIVAYSSDGTKAAIANGNINVLVPLPSVNLGSISNTTSTGATLNASIVSDGADNGGVPNFASTQEGFNYGTTTSYGTKVYTTSSISSYPFSFSQSLSNLNCGTTYYYQPYAQNINGTNYGLGSYFTTSPCTVSFSANDVTIPASATTTFTLTGNGTAWVTGSTGTFSVSGLSYVNILSQSVTSPTSATIKVSIGGSVGQLIITDNAGHAGTVFVNAAATAEPVVPVNQGATTTLIPETLDASTGKPAIYYSQGNSYIDPSTGYVQWEHTASTAKFNFTGTILNMNLDLTPLIQGATPPSVYPYIDWRINGGLWQRAMVYPTNGIGSSQTMPLCTGIASCSSSAPNSIEIRFEQGYLLGGYESSWTPLAAVNITGWQVASGSSISAPSLEGATNFTSAGISLGLRPKKMLIFGDSITRGYNAGYDNVTNSDVTGTTTTTGHLNTFPINSWAPLFAQALDADPSLVAYSGQGWFEDGSAGTFFQLTYNMFDSTHPRTWPTNLDYVVIAQGTNDSAIDVTNAVTTTLTNMRNTVGPNTVIFVVPNFNDYDATIVTEIDNGFTNYQTAYPSDKKVFLIDPGVILGGPSGTSTPLIFAGGVHPNLQGHAVVAQDLAALAVADAPTQLSNVAVTYSGATPIVSWTTDRSATSQVIVNSTTYTGTNAVDPTNSNLILHSVNITGLQAGSYSYQIVSTDTASVTQNSTGTLVVPGNIPYGDVNSAVDGSGNPIVTIEDAELTAQKAIGIQVQNFNTAAALVDGGSSVDINDAFLIAEYAIKKITSFPL